jgi:hypothetical protein
MMESTAHLLSMFHDVIVEDYKNAEKALDTDQVLEAAFYAIMSVIDIDEAQEELTADLTEGILESALRLIDLVVSLKLSRNAFNDAETIRSWIEREMLKHTDFGSVVVERSTSHEGYKIALNIDSTTHFCGE